MIFSPVLCFVLGVSFPSVRKVEGDNFLCALQAFKHVSDLVLERSSSGVFMCSFECLAE